MGSFWGLGGGVGDSGGFCGADDEFEQFWGLEKSLPHIVALAGRNDHVNFPPEGLVALA